MKSSLCGSALPGAIRTREKPRKNLYRGVFSAEVIAALPLSSLLLSPLLGGTRLGVSPGKPGTSQVLAPCCGCLFWGQAQWGHGSVSAVVGQGRTTEAPTLHRCAWGSCKVLFLHKPFKKIDIW